MLLERPRNKYDKTGATYETVTYGSKQSKLYCEVRNQQVLRVLRDYFPDKDLRILEIGCGTGLLLECLASTGRNHTIVGLDLSLTMLAQAHRRLANNAWGPAVVLASALRLPFASGSFDVVVACRFIHLFEHQQKKDLYEEFRRVLHDGGITVVEFYARAYHWLRYYLSDARRKKSAQAYFSHYPTRAQVKSIVRGRFTRYPVRLAGSRMLLRLLGDRVLRSLTCCVPFPAFNPLVDEYLVVARK